MANNAVYANIGTYGVNDQPQVGPLMQAQSGVVMLFTLADLTGTPIDLTDLVLTGTITNNLTSETAALAGALTIVTAEDGIFSWLTDADDVGTAGEFTLIFQAGEDIISLPAHLSILETPGASVTFGAALLGVTAAERAWLTEALAAVPNAADLAKFGIPVTVTGDWEADEYSQLIADVYAVLLPAEGRQIEFIAYTHPIGGFRMVGVVADDYGIITGGNVFLERGPWPTSGTVYLIPIGMIEF